MLSAAARSTSCIKGARHLGAQTQPADTASSTTSSWGTRQPHEAKVDSEAGMLSGISQKRSIRSNPCWFTEFCKSQCLSHFAAPFIVVRAETSVAESCKEAIAVWRSPPAGNASTTRKRSEDNQQWEAPSHHHPRTTIRGEFTLESSRW